MKVSVAIPAYEYYGRGVEFLDDMFRTISQQTLKDVEVVISDHSVNSDVKNYCLKNEYNLNIKYVLNEEQRGSAGHNTNVAIDNCSGEVIKIIQQDDFLYDTEALEKIYNELSSSDKKWLVCGAIHTRDDGNTFFNPMYPYWSPLMIYENNNNFIGGLSNLSFKKEVSVRLDLKTTMLLDVDLYYNLRLTYGDGIYYNDILIGNRVRDTDSLSATVTPEQIQSEFNYCHSKYNL
jgi:glycosyltransferase involved in cell wall biosynthesis